MSSDENKSVGFLEISGRRITEDEQGNICLNDLWELADKPENQKPSDWSRSSDAKKLIRAMIRSLKSGTENFRSGPEITNKSLCYEGKRLAGRSRTFAHPNLALAYAKYLSPDLAIQVNDVFLRYRRGDSALAKEILQQAEARKPVAITQRESLTQTQEWLMGITMKAVASEVDDLKAEVEDLRQEPQKRAWAEAERDEARRNEQEQKKRADTLDADLGAARENMAILVEQRESARKQAENAKLRSEQYAKTTLEAVAAAFRINDAAYGVIKGNYRKLDEILNMLPPDIAEAFRNRNNRQKVLKLIGDN